MSTEKDRGAMGICLIADRVCSESTIFNTAAQVFPWNQPSEIQTLKQMSDKSYCTCNISIFYGRPISMQYLLLLERLSTLKASSSVLSDNTIIYVKNI